MKDFEQLLVKNTLILENGYTKISIEFGRTDNTLHDIIENGVIPLLLAAGYNKETLEQYIPLE